MAARAVRQNLSVVERRSHSQRRLLYAYKEAEAYRASQPDAQRSKSPIYIHSHGLHWNFDVGTTLRLIKPFYALATQFPRPFNFYFSQHCPGEKKPVDFVPSQGKEAARRYNEAISEGLADVGPLEEAPLDVDFFHMSEGAASYDGTHMGAEVRSFFS